MQLNAHLSRCYQTMVLCCWMEYDQTFVSNQIGLISTASNRIGFFQNRRMDLRNIKQNQKVNESFFFFKSYMLYLKNLSFAGYIF